jgi:Golgi phosphoprotein 3 GPP34
VAAGRLLGVTGVRTLADDLLVLAIGGRGRLRLAGTLPYGLRGAELAELVAAGRVAVETKGGPIRLTVLDPSPVGDALLDRAIQWLLSEPVPVHPTAFIRRPVGRSPNIHLDHLEALGTIAVDTSPGGRPAPARIRVIDPEHRAAARTRVDHVLDPDRQHDPHDEMLAALVQAIGLGSKLYAGPIRRRQRKRLEKIAELNWAAITVRRAVPGSRSDPSLPWTTTHFGGLPPGTTGPGDTP